MNNEKNSQELPTLIDSIELDEATAEVASKIVKESDVEKIKDLTHLFNLQQTKKNALRILKLNSLLDHVSDQMMERFKKRPDEFSHRDLLDYMTVTQNAIDRAQKSLQLVEETPAITLNQQNNQLNINVTDGLSRESKEKVITAIRSLMSRCQDMQNSGTQEVIDVPDNKIENNNTGDLK